VEELKWFSSLGVGGILAGVMFFFYRLDRRDSEARLHQVIEEMMKIGRANAEALGALVRLIEDRVVKE